MERGTPPPHTPTPLAPSTPRLGSRLRRSTLAPQLQLLDPPMQLDAFIDPIAVVVTELFNNSIATTRLMLAYNVRPFVCVCVPVRCTLRYNSDLSWVSSKVITRVIS